MAARKAVTTPAKPTVSAGAAGKAPAKGRALVKWEEELAKYAQEAQATEASVGTGSFISTKSGILSYNGGDMPGNKMSVIVLDHIIEHAFYEGLFDPDAPASPICFAFGRSADDMAPHEKSAAPQADNCAECPHAEFGTSNTGKGKACKQIRRLALIPEDGLGNVEDATVAFLKTPVTSGKPWAGYVNQLASVLHRPPFGVVTEIGIVPDAKTQYKLTFNNVEELEGDAVFSAIIAKREAAQTDLFMPYSPPSEDPAPPRRGGRAAPKKPAARAAAKPPPTARAAPKATGRVAAQAAPAPARQGRAKKY